MQKASAELPFLVENPVVGTQTLMKIAVRTMNVTTKSSFISRIYFQTQMYKNLKSDIEYVFLSAGKFMPGMEKLAGELFFPTNQQLFLTTEGSKNSWF